MLPGLQTHACRPVRVMHEGEFPVGLADILPGRAEGHAQNLVSPRGTNFDGLGFVGLGSRRRGVARDFDDVGLREDGEGVGGFRPLEQSLELPHNFSLYSISRGPEHVPLFAGIV